MISFNKFENSFYHSSLPQRLPILQLPYRNQNQLFSHPLFFIAGSLIHAFDQELLHRNNNLLLQLRLNLRLFDLHLRAHLQTNSPHSTLHPRVGSAQAGNLVCLCTSCEGRRWPVEAVGKLFLRSGKAARVGRIRT